jgi:hypothetical protein
MTRRLLLVSMAATWVLPLGAQQLEPNFMLLTYTSVPQEQREACEKFLQGVGRKLRQAALDIGLIKGSLNLRLAARFITTENHQYAMVLHYDKVPAVDEAARAAWEQTATKAGFASYSEYLSKLRVIGGRS